jgi:hypothetical protein
VRVAAITAANLARTVADHESVAAPRQRIGIVDFATQRAIAAFAGAHPVCSTSVGQPSTGSETHKQIAPSTPTEMRASQNTKGGRDEAGSFD